MTNVILVHGAFHTGECWYRLIPVLQRRGFAVQAPTLRGQRGNPRHPLRVTLRGYADDIVACAGRLDGPAILLGHSLAGFAISVAAERRPELFSSLIYVAAAIPKPGRSTLKDATPSESSKAPRMKPRLAVTFPAAQASGFFYNRCEPETQARAGALLSPQPVRPMLGTVRSTPARLGSVPKHFVECLQDRVASIEHQRQAQAHMAFDGIHTLDTDHSPFLSDPEALADIIEQVATRAAGRS